MRHWVLLWIAALSSVLAVQDVRAGRPGDTEKTSIVLIVSLKADGSGIAGTGFVIAPGLIATNAHVAIADAQSYFVIPNNTTERRPATLLWVDRDADVAVLQVPDFSAPPLRVSLAELHDGDKVYAVGYPDSSVERQSVNGIFNARTTNGEITEPISPAQFGLNNHSYPAISHDASIGHGNSGGPLLDDCGRVIGINTLGVATNQDFTASTIINFKALLAAQHPEIQLTASTETCEQLAQQNSAPPSAPSAPAAQPPSNLHEVAPAPDNGAAQSPSFLQWLKGIPVWIWLALVGGIGALTLVAQILTRRRPGTVETDDSGQDDVSTMPAPTAHNWRLVPTAGGAGLSIPAGPLTDRFGVTIGRSPAFADVVLAGDDVSRLHLRLIAKDGALWAEDLNSTHGSAVGFSTLTPFKPVSVAAGDLVKLGAHVFRLEAATGSPVSPIRRRHVTLLVGRNSECDLEFRNDSVSRRHAELVLSDTGTALLTDRGSSQGTFVRSGDSWGRIEHLQLTPEMRLRFGKAEVSARRLLQVARGAQAPASAGEPEPTGESDIIRRNPLDGSVS